MQTSVTANIQTVCYLRIAASKLRSLQNSVLSSDRCNYNPKPSQATWCGDWVRMNRKSGWICNIFIKSHPGYISDWHSVCIPWYCVRRVLNFLGMLRPLPWLNLIWYASATASNFIYLMGTGCNHEGMIILCGEACSISDFYFGVLLEMPYFIKLSIYTWIIRHMGVAHPDLISRYHTTVPTRYTCDPWEAWVYWGFDAPDESSNIERHMCESQG